MVVSFSLGQVGSDRLPEWACARTKKFPEGGGRARCPLARKSGSYNGVTRKELPGRERRCIHPVHTVHHFAPATRWIEAKTVWQSSCNTPVHDSFKIDSHVSAVRRVRRTLVRLPQSRSGLSGDSRRAEIQPGRS